MSATALIDQLRLLPHPEGGHFRETYRAAATCATAAGATRNVSTAIYYLLQRGEKSRFHRIQSDELWFFHQGQALEIVVLTPAGPSFIRLGQNLAAGEVPQAVVPAHCWFGARLVPGSDFALVSCTVAPGFDFADFELADQAALTAEFPRAAALIAELT